ncbi:ribbon-helix-helix protein, CopG family [Thermococcus sp.]
MRKMVRGFSIDRETLLMIDLLATKLGVENKSAIVREAVREKYYRTFGNISPRRLQDGGKH